MYIENWKFKVLVRYAQSVREYGMTNILYQVNGNAAFFVCVAITTRGGKAGSLNITNLAIY